VGGTVMPHALAVKMNGQVVQNLTFSQIDTNVDVEDSLFTMPEKKTAEAAE